MATTSMPAPALPAATARDVAIAIPARNEAATIAACLRALDAAARQVRTPRPITAIVLVNGTTDATAAIARALPTTAIRIKVLETTLPAALCHAGGARGAAMDAALHDLAPGGVIMTTDADSQVTPGWIAANLAEIEAGADAVAGVVAFDAEARATLPALPPARSLEWQLAGLQAQLRSLLDPRPHDPWPNHIWTWGASIAITRTAYVAVGGLPRIALAEDRALAAAIERHDLNLRHSHAPVVHTSARRVGRAPGGFADLLDRYAADPLMACDAAIEPVAALVRRARWRALLRRCHVEAGPAIAALIARRGLAVWVIPAPGFGAFWSMVEAQSALLARTRVGPATLPRELQHAERLISRLSATPAGRADTPPSALAA